MLEYNAFLGKDDVFLKVRDAVAGHHCLTFAYPFFALSLPLFPKTTDSELEIESTRL